MLEAVTRGRAGDVQVVAAASRGSAQSRSLTARYGIPHVHPNELPAKDLAVIVEAAGHSAVHGYVPAYLQTGIDVILLSAGALADDAVLAKVHEAASAGKARVYIPSGGIAGLDGIKAMMGADAEVSITSSKSGKTWTTCGSST